MCCKGGLRPIGCCNGSQNVEVLAVVSALYVCLCWKTACAINTEVVEIQ